MTNFLSPPIEPIGPEGETWKGIARFSGSEPFFADHFPGYPLVPGVLLFEILRLTAEKALKESGKQVRLCKCTRVRFIQPVTPPADLEAIVSESRRQPLLMKGELHNSKGEKVATASFLFEEQRATE